jgi:hypothetical protein
LLHTGGGAEQSVLSYWNDNGSANGTVSLTFSNFSGSSFPVSETTASETPCPRGPSGDYWGDYDSMVVHNDGSNGAVLLRYITDSTASACSNGLPQHVSFFVD